MQPWMIDAANIEMNDGFDAKSVTQTVSIKDFLEKDSRNITFVVATKGFGKTFLLKAKRVLDKKSGNQWIPEDQLVDKPSGIMKGFSAENVSKMMMTEDFWENIWLYSIALSVLKHGECKNITFISETFNKILKGEVDTITDIFASMLSIGYNDYFNNAIEDFNLILKPRYRHHNGQLLVFIDNIDEYFDNHLKEGLDKKNSDEGLNKDFWYAAQMGLVKAIYSLRQVNDHVKIFCSIRREAFFKLLAEDQRGQQFKGASLTIEYTDDDLIDMFIKNVEMEDEDNLVTPFDSTASCFTGVSELSHPFVDCEKETIESYMLRHTLRRPRDLMEIGKEIHSISPRNRNENTIREVVNKVSSGIATQYINEIKPHIGNFDLDFIFERIPSNIFSKEEMLAISSAFDMKYDDEKNKDGNHIFCSLYKVGLIGVVGLNPGRELRQIFIKPGDMTFAENNILPDKTDFIVHPILDSLISSLSENYAESYSCSNVSGHGNLWNRPQEEVFVITCDIVNYSAIMADADTAHSYPTEFNKIVEKFPNSLKHFDLVGGDSFLLVDNSFNRILSALMSLKEQLNSIKPELNFRAGGDFGLVNFSGAKPISGSALRGAARLEGIGTPENLIITERFYKSLEEESSNRFANATKHEVKSGTNQNIKGQFNIAKKGSQTDAEEWHNLYSLNLNADSEEFAA